MGISYSTPNLCPSHIETLIFLVGCHIRTDRSAKAWPTTTRIKFILRGKEGLTGHDIYINTGIKLIPVTIGEGTFSIIFVSPHTLREITSFDFLIAWLGVATSINNRIRSLIDIDMAVPIRMFL